VKIKNFLGVIMALALLVGGPALATDGNAHNLVAVTTTATGATLATAGSCARAVVWSASTSSATVLFEQSADGTVWTTTATFTDPSSTATTSVWSNAKYSRARVSARASGTISADIAWATCTLFPTNITSFNNYTFTKPAAAATLTIANNKTLTASNSITLAGTDGVTLTTPSTSFTAARTDAANTFTGVQTFSSVPVFSAGVRGLGAAKATDGAISMTNGTIFITKTSALGSSTVATPTATTHDYWRLRFVSTTAYAHVLTFASGKVNGGSNTTATFGGAIGDTCEFEAYQGIWYMVGGVNCTVAP